MYNIILVSGIKYNNLIFLYIVGLMIKSTLFHSQKCPNLSDVICSPNLKPNLLAIDFCNLFLYCPKMSLF